MGWIPGPRPVDRRRRAGRLPAMIEVQEPRALLADGITALGGAPIQAVAGVPINNALFATYTEAIRPGSLALNSSRRSVLVTARRTGRLFLSKRALNSRFEDTHTYRARACIP